MRLLESKSAKCVAYCCAYPVPMTLSAQLWIIREVCMKSPFRLAALVAMCLLSTLAQAEFTLDKYRVVLASGERSIDLRIFNTGEDYSSYRVQLLDMQMDEEGQLSPVEDYAYSAKQLVRIGPRMSKNLTPHTYQKVRIRARGNNEDGEFRTHLLIEELLPPYEGDLQGMVLRPNLKMIIPVIVQSGNVDVDVTADQFQFDAESHKLTFVIHRQGNASAFGNMVLVDPDGNEVFRKHNIGIYREIEQRHFTIDLPDGIASVKDYAFTFLQAESEMVLIHHTIES